MRPKWSSSVFDAIIPPSTSCGRADQSTFQIGICQSLSYIVLINKEFSLFFDDNYELDLLSESSCIANAKLLSVDLASRGIHHKLQNSCTACGNTKASHSPKKLILQIISKSWFCKDVCFLEVGYVNKAMYIVSCLLCKQSSSCQANCFVKQSCKSADYFGFFGVFNFQLPTSNCCELSIVNL